MKKTISALAFAILIAFAFAPLCSFAQTFSQPKNLFQEEYSYETILAIADALEDLDHCTSEQALQWYKEGNMTIDKIDSNTYHVVTPNGGLLIILSDEL